MDKKKPEYWKCYLNEGAGYPWALPLNSKAWLTSRVIEILFTSFENEGAFSPMGSRNFNVKRNEKAFEAFIL